MPLLSERVTFHYLAGIAPEFDYLILFSILKGRPINTHNVRRLKSTEDVYPTQELAHTPHTKNKKQQKNKNLQRLCVCRGEEEKEEEIDHDQAILHSSNRISRSNLASPNQIRPGDVGRRLSTPMPDR